MLAWFVAPLLRRVEVKRQYWSKGAINRHQGLQPKTVKAYWHACSQSNIRKYRHLYVQYSGFSAELFSISLQAERVLMCEVYLGWARWFINFWHASNDRNEDWVHVLIPGADRCMLGPITGVALHDTHMRTHRTRIFSPNSPTRLPPCDPSLPFPFRHICSYKCTLVSENWPGKLQLWVQLPMPNLQCLDYEYLVL